MNIVAYFIKNMNFVCCNQFCYWITVVQLYALFMKISRLSEMYLSLFSALMTQNCVTLNSMTMFFFSLQH